MGRKKKNEGFDPEGDGPNFKDDTSKMSPEEAREFAKKMAKARKGPKKKQEPTEEEIARGIERQSLMNQTQFREPEDRGPNPNWVPPPPGSPGGPPLPKPKDD